MVGDPSGRDHARSKKLSAEEVETNARDYLAQVGKVVDLSKADSEAIVEETTRRVLELVASGDGRTR